MSDIIDRMALAMVRRTAQHYGDPIPSDPDLTLTRELVRAALSEVPLEVREYIDRETMQRDESVTGVVRQSDAT